MSSRILLLALCLPSTLLAANWPSWRGIAGDGITAETDLPLTWSATENVKWKVSLPEPGNSTPIVWGDRIFLTQAVGADRLLIALSRKDGAELWRGGAKGVEREPTHETNPYCSSSPVTDGGRVIAWFGSGGLWCFDLEGKELWHRDLGPHRHMWGYAAAPVIHGDLCYLNFGPGDRTFLLAVDKSTGKDVWRVEVPAITPTLPRTDGFGAKADGVIGSWSTPIVVKTGEREELVITYPEQVQAYDLKTGKQLWHCRGLNPLIYTSPVAGEGVVVGTGGYGGSSLAVRAGGSGDVTDSHRLWHKPRDQQRIGTGVIKDGHLYILNTPGVAQCIELKTGAVVWQERLAGSATRTCLSLICSQASLSITLIRFPNPVWRHLHIRYFTGKELIQHVFSPHQNGLSSRKMALPRMPNGIYPMDYSERHAPVGKTAAHRNGFR